MSAEVSEPVTTVTDATSAGAPAGPGVDEGLALVGGAGGRDGAGEHRDDGEDAAGVGGVLHADPPRGTMWSTVRQVMSPPAERQKSVSDSARRCPAARSIAHPFTTPLGSRRRRP